MPKKHWLLGAVVFAVLLIVGTSAIVRPAAAATSCGLTTISASCLGQGIVLGVSNIFLVFALAFIKLAVAFLRIFMEVAAYNGYIDAPPVVIGWYMVRDIANMFFVVALLVIAFGTILGLEQYEWKKSLVKLVLAAIFINFSRLLIQLAIDASHIVTVTFLDAVQGTAGGNLINMLKLNKILSMARAGVQDAGNEDIQFELLAGSLLAFIFALMAMVSIGAYLIIMVIRVVILWVLIILSPLAFVLSAIPQTKKYADDMWQELVKYIIVAPVMVFFLWLAFATMGNGDINNVVGVKTGGVGAADYKDILQISSGASAGRVSIAEISTWENMSAFIIAIAFLFVGLDRVQKIGVVGSSFVSGAASFGKNVLTIASGYAAGRWLAGTAARGAKAGATALGKGAIEPFVSYGKIAGERIQAGRAKLPLPIIGRKGALQREAALKRAKEYREAVEKEVSARGPGIGPAALLAPSKQSLARQTLATTRAERQKKAEAQEIEAKLKLEMTKEEEKIRDDRYNKLAAAHIARTGRPPSLKEQSDMRLEAIKGLALSKLFESEARAAGISGKGESEEKRIAANVADWVRQYEGKRPEKLIEFEDAEVKGDAAKMNQKTYDELFGIIEQNYKDIQRFNTLSSTRSLDSNEQKQLENATKSQMSAITSAYERGYGKFLSGKLKSIDTSRSFDNVDFNDENTNHILDMALLSGGVRSGFEDSAGSLTSTDAKNRQAGMERDMIGARLKEKQAALMRGLMYARNKDASDFGGVQSFNQVRSGKNQSGTDVMGWSNLMIGSARGIGTTDRLASDVIGTSGPDVRSAKQSYLLRTKTLRDINGANYLSDRKVRRRIGGRDIHVATAYSSTPGMREKLISLANLGTSEIRSLRLDQIRALTGGDDENSTWDGTQFQVERGMQADFAGIFQAFRQRYVAAETPQGQERVGEALQTFLTQAGVPIARASQIRETVMPPHHVPGAPLGPITIPDLRTFMTHI